MDPWVFPLVLALLLALVGWWAASTRASRSSRRRTRRAQAGEADAEHLLERSGYEVVERQATGRWTLEVDGARVEVHCRADLIVRRDDRTLVAEVKTGRRAPEPTHPATRRQLLEYLLAFEADGVLLVDVEGGHIREVDFPFLRTRRR